MDIATPVGIVVGLVSICVAFILEGGNPAVMVSLPSPILLVLGGTLGVALASNRLGDVGGVVKATMRTILPGKKIDSAGTVTSLMEFADVARREGLLALEEKAKAVEDPYLRRGLELVIDGTDSEEVLETLEMDTASLKERHKVAAKFHADCGAFAPTIGIIGTVLGLVHAMEQLDDPSALGHAIGAAFLATLWGVMSANVFFLPLSNKMKRTSAVEVAYRELVVAGVLAIQAGVSPRQVGERLKSHLAPALRDGVSGKGKGEKAA